jgi:hypothetical protein
VDLGASLDDTLFVFMGESIFADNAEGTEVLSSCERNQSRKANRGQHIPLEELLPLSIDPM